MKIKAFIGLALILLFILCLGTGLADIGGNCGNNVRWSLNTQTGALTISGTGAMKDYTSSEYREWKSYSIKTVTINSGVTRIGNNAFNYLSSLTTVTMANSVISIGDNAFSSCSKLESLTLSSKLQTIGDSAFSSAKITSITIPDSVTYIGRSAFGSCSMLQSVSLPSGLTSIQSSTFGYCRALSSISIPETVTAIGDKAFSNCTALGQITLPGALSELGSGVFSGCSLLTGVGISDDNDVFFSQDGVLYRRQPLSLIILPMGKTGGFTFPEGITEIADYAFDHSALTTMTIPDTVTAIGDYAFQSSALTTVSLPSGLIRISDGVFKDCASLAQIDIPGAVSSIGADAFRNCTGLQSISLPSDLESIGNYAFGNCTGLQAIDLPSSLTEIGNSAFYKCTGLTSMTLPDSLAVFGKTIFKDCSNLAELALPSGIEEIPESLFEGMSGLTGYEIPQGVTSIGTAAFKDCSNLQAVTIPAGVESIGKNAFSGCVKLSSVTVPDGTESIGEGAFNGCSLLSLVSLPNSVTSIGTSAFANCKTLSAISLPAGLRTVPGSLFSGCSALTCIVIQEGVTGIGNHAFDGCTELTSVSLPDTVTSIGENAFYGCFSLSDIRLSNGLTEIKRYTFNCLNSLKSITIPNSVGSIGERAFKDCTNLESVVITSDSLVFDSYVFMNDDKLTIFGYPDSPAETYAKKQSIPFSPLEYPLSGTCGSGLFWKLDNEQGILIVSGSGRMTDYEAGEAPWGTEIRRVKLPSGITYIGSNAFYGCNQLAEITIPFGVQSIGNHAFKGCSALTGIALPSSVGTIGEGVFRGTGLTTVEIPADMKSVSASAFSDCPDLTSVTVRDGVERIGDSVFSGCSALESIILPESVLSIGDAAFLDCGALESATLRNAAAELSENAFAATSLLTIRGYSGSTAEAFAGTNGIPFEAIAFTGSGSCGDGVTWSLDDMGLLTISGSGAMKDYSYSENPPWGRDITGAVVENGVTYVGAHTFRNSVNLRSVSLAESVTGLGDFAFENCDSLVSIRLPSRLQSVGYEAIRHCDSLTELILPASLTEIGDNAFECNYALKYVFLPDTITSLPHCMFYGCTKLESVRLPSGLQSMSDQVFRGCSSLKTIELPDTLTAIGEYAFTRCTALTEIKLPANLKTIGIYAFSECTSLAELRIPYGATTIQGYAFSYCDKFHIYIPETVSNINSSAFYPLSEEKKPVIHGRAGSYAQTFANNAGYTFIAVDAIDSGTCGASLNWVLDEDGHLTVTGSGDMYDYSSQGPWGTGVKRVTLPDGLTSIGSHAFYGCPELKEVYLPQTVTSVGYQAFQYAVPCAQIGSEAAKAASQAGFYFKDPGSPFYYMHPNSDGQKLTLASNPDKLVTEVTIPDGVTELGMSAFQDCSLLQRIHIPSSVSVIQGYAFYNCSSLREITLSAEPVSYISRYAFEGCTSLNNVTITSGTASLSRDAFDDGNSIRLIVTGDIELTSTTGRLKVKTLDWHGTHTIPDAGITDLGNCGNSVYWMLIGSKITVFGNGPMNDFIFNSNAYGTNSIMNMSCSAPWWSYMGSVTNVEIRSGVTSIGDYAFAYFQKQLNISIGRTVSRIGQSAFLRIRATVIQNPVDYYFNGNYGGDSITWILPGGSCGSGANWQFVNMTRMRITGSGQVSLPDWSIYAAGKTVLVVGPEITGIDSDVLSSLPELTEVIFEGDAPSDLNAALGGFTGSVCYRHGNSGWTEEARSVEGITWLQYCGSDRSEVIPAASEEVELLPCTCTEDGHYAHWKCSVCNELFADSDLLTATTPESVLIPAPGHTEEVVPGYAATCTEPGLSDDIFCGVCGEIIQEATVIPCIPHTDVITLARQEPTCTEPGHTARHECSCCGQVLTESEVIPVIPHTEEVTMAALNPTCTAPGHTEERSCSVCGTVLSPAQEIPAAGHHYGEPSFAWAEDGSACSVTFVCLAEDDTITLSADITDAVTADPECLAPGRMQHTASVTFGDVTHTDVFLTDIPALGHSRVEDSGYPPTDREPGLTGGSHCSVCGAILTEQAVIPANWSYSEDGLTVTAYNASATDVVIPDGVEALSNDLFKGNQTVTSVRVPDSVATVGTQTFYGMTAVEDIWLPDSLSGITTQTFYNNSAALHASVGSQTARLLSLRGKNFTAGCWTLRYRVSSAESDPTSVFLAGWQGEDSALVLPGVFGGVPVREILSGAFAGQSQLSTITIPDSVTAIADNAFAGCADDLTIRSSWTAYARTWAASNNIRWIHDEHIPEAIPAVAATCEEPGLTEGSVCSECGEVLAAQQKIRPLGHDWSEPAYVWTEDHSQVTATRRCTRNESHTESETVTDINSEITEQPTCAKAGTKVYTSAAFLNSAFTAQTAEETLPPVSAHTLEMHEEQAATCTAPGSSAYWSCSVCGKYFSDGSGGNEIGEGSWIIPGGHSMIHVAAVAQVSSEYWHCSSCGRYFSDETGETEISLTDTVLEEIDQTGSCGESISWVLTQDDTLIISGTGTIPGNDQKSIFLGLYPRKVIIQEGITGIDINVFRDLTTINSVEFPETLTSIGTCAFYGCSNLRSLSLPGRLKTIASSAFCNCSGLNATGSMETLVIPDSVTSIGSYAFSGLFKVYQLTFEGAVPAIAEKAFYNSQNTMVFITVQDARQAGSLTTAAGLPSSAVIASYAWTESEGTWHCTASKRTAGSTSVSTAAATVTSTATTTCTVSGQRTYTAAFAVSSYLLTQKKTVEEEAPGHAMTKTEARAATCSETGNNEYWTCSRCNGVFADENGETGTTVAAQTLAVLDHNLAWEEEEAASCTETGHIAGWTCSLCGRHFSDAAGETGIADDSWVTAAHHTLTEHPATDATCTAAGNSAYWSCEKCHKYFSDDSGAADKEIAENSWTRQAIGHAWGEPTYVWAEDFSSVTARRVCGNDASHIEEETVQTTATVIREATCADTEQTSYTASFENPAFSVEPKTVDTAPALTHTWGEPKYIWAEDHSSVTARRVCVHNTSHIEEETAAAAFEVTLAPTYEAKGERTYTAVFTNPVFTAQTETVEDIEPLNESTVLELPKELTKIPDEAFSHIAVEAVIIPDGCTSIGSRSFAYCEKLIYIYIPASVDPESIPDDAFTGCPQLVICYGK